MAGAETIRQALIIALRKPSPDRIPMSGLERLRTRDYYSVTFDDNKNRSFLVNNLNNDDIAGSWVSFEFDPEPASIPLNEILSKPLTIRQYIGELEYRYTSPIEFIWYTRLFIPQIKLFRERTANYFFSRRLLSRSDRIVLLRDLIDCSVEEDRGKSVVEIMSDIHGPRIWQHPRQSAELRYTKLLLDSLLEAGELNNENGRYRATPKAISSTIEHDLEDRRHRENVRQQRWMVLLTIILAITGGVQAYQAWILSL